jgi:hypothetical protein
MPIDCPNKSAGVCRCGILIVYEMIRSFLVCSAVWDIAKNLLRLVLLRRVAEF